MSRDGSYSREDVMSAQGERDVAYRERNDALEIMIRVAKGEQTVPSMAHWLAKTYPDRFTIPPEAQKQVDYTPGNH